MNFKFTLIVLPKSLMNASPGLIRRTHVGLLDPIAAPRSCLDGTKTYGMSLSSKTHGKWEYTSIGKVSPAKIAKPFSPFLTNFTTSWKKINYKIRDFFCTEQLWFLSSWYCLHFFKSSPKIQNFPVKWNTIEVSNFILKITVYIKNST